MDDSNTTARTRSLREPVLAERLAPSPNAALQPHAGEYSLIQLEALSGIALKEATRNLRLSSTWTD